MAGLATDLRRGLAVAAVELRRSLRAVLSSRRQLLAFGFLLVAFLPAGLTFLSGSYAAGVRYSGGADAPVRTLARAQVVAWLGSTSVLFSLRMVERAGDVDHADLLLTTVSPRAVVTGLALAEYGRVTAVFGLPIALYVAAFAAGAGTPLMVPVVVLGLLPLLAVAVLGGYVIGYLARLAYARLGWGRLSQTAVGLVSLGAFLVVVNGFVPADVSVVLEATAPLSAVPVGPYADLMLVGSPFDVSPGPAAGLAAGLLAGLGGTLLVTTWRLAPRVWYADPVLKEDGAAATRLRVGGVPSPLSAVRTGRLVWWQLLRGARAPSQFVHLTYFLFMGFPVAQLALANPRSVVLPAYVGVLVAFLAGGSFGLNPIGVEGSVLPVLLTNPAPGRAVVRSRALAGLVVCLAVGLPVVVGLCWYSRQSAAETALLVAFVVVLSGFAAVLAPALGTFSPRFDAVRAFGGVEAPTPTTATMLGYALTTVLVAVVGLAALFVPAAIDRPPFVGPTERVVQAGALGVWTAVVGLAAALCYRYAVGRIDGFRYD